MIRYCKLFGVFIIAAFFFFITCALASQEIPRVVENTIHFLDGETIIQMEDKDSYYIFPKQNRLVYINYQLKPNFVEYKLKFFDFKGTKIAEPDIINGYYIFIFAETTERVLAGQRATLTRQNESFLYDLDGNLLNVLVHDYESKQIGINEDEGYFWFAANKMRPLTPGENPFYPGMANTPYNHIIIFDAETGEFVEDHSTDESNFSFFIKGKTYSIIVGSPDVPG